MKETSHLFQFARLAPVMSFSATAGINCNNGDTTAGLLWGGLSISFAYAMARSNGAAIETNEILQSYMDKSKIVLSNPENSLSEPS